jgi:O-antigen/teichoic acid export membrane protein
MLTTAPLPAEPSRKTRFLQNVVWSWSGVAVNILLGLFLSPILVRKLGVAQYGVWVLLFTTVDYLRLLDLGLRAAVVNRCARQRAQGDWHGVNETLSTAILYFITTSALACLVAVAGRDAAMRLFKIEPALHNDARLLMLIIAASISARLIFSPLTAALEAFQRYDLINRAYIGNLAVRATGSLGLLLAGFGLVPLGWLVLFVTIGEDAWNFFSLRRIYPHLQLSPALVRRGTFAHLFSYGKHSSVWTIANMFEVQAPSTVLGSMRGPTEVAYFALPWRLLMYTTEAFTKVGQITTSVTAELDVTADARSVWNMAVVTNRMCLALFMPVAVFLTIFAAPLLSVWVSAEMSAGSARLMPVLMIPFVFAIAGQFNSGSVLMGQARHRGIAWGVVVEVVVMIAALFVVAPRYGAFGVSCVVAAAFTAVRGAFLAVLICRVNNFSVVEYVTAIYVPPFAAAVPAAIVGTLLRLGPLPGRNWFELIAAAATIGAVYFAIAIFTVLDVEMRRLLLARSAALLRR